jgi:SPP1 gp7 family putative phage head morphogenesis protein
VDNSQKPPAPPPSNGRQPIDQGIIARVTGAFKVITGKAIPVVDDGSAWMGPLNPLQPLVGTPGQMESLVGRQFDYQPGYNQRTRPRSEEAVTFGQMRALADNCDVLRLVIETRKDQIEKLEFSIKPRDEKAKPDPRCQEVEDFLKFPDGEHSWHVWLRQLMEELFVTDAPCIYPWLNNDGTPYRFELMDGATVKRVIDPRGRTPAPPEPAYQQVLKGIPAVDYTLDELIYLPRNQRVHKVYGYSPVEQIIITVNIAIRRSLYQLQYYTDGSSPDLIFAVPPEWNMTQIKEFNDWWQDSLSGNTSTRRKAQFVPNGMTPINTKDAILKDDYDEWLARIICYAFSVSPQAFAKQMNRATSETAHEMALQEGLFPIMLWIKSLVDLLIWKYFGYKDIEFAWKDETVIAPEIQNKMDDINVKNGTSAINEIRARRGDAPVDGGDVPMVLTATGYVPIEPAEPEPIPAPLAPGQGQPVIPANGVPAAPAAKETDKPVGKMEKVSKRIPRINRSRKDIVKNRKALQKGVHSILQKQLAAIIKQLPKISKADEVDDDVMAGVEWEGWEAFNDLFGESLSLSAKSGVSAAYSQIGLNDPEAFTVANEGAIEFAKNRAAELVGKRINKDGEIVDNPNAEYSIDDATRELIRSDVTTAMEEGWSNDELAAVLEDNYAFSDTRAETIARTETAFADTNGNKELYTSSGLVDTKQWIVGLDCCDICAEVDGEIVGLDELFSNEVDVPPGHPNCRCDFLPGLKDTQDDQSESSNSTEEE